MALLKYFQKKGQGDLVLPGKEVCPSLSNEDLKSAGEKIKEHLQASGSESNKRGKYNRYDAEKRAEIGKYASENGPTRASRHFDVPEPTARRLKVEYLHKLREIKSTYNDGNYIPVVKSLPTKCQGRPLMLGEQLDAAVRDYIQGMRTVGGVVNTIIVLAAAEGIITARDQSLLVQNGGHIKLTKSWAKSLLKRMGYVKRKCSNAGKISVFRFEEIQSDFLADIQAEVVMNEIPEELIFNWDQTPLQFVPTGQWTMHKAGEKIIPIANSDDKRQVTGVFAATIKGEFLPPQVIYQGKTERCHPKVKVPDGWDVWHSDNHWSNEITMKRYLEKIVIPFLERKRKALNLSPSHPALAIFDCFRGQTTPEFYRVLKQHNIAYVIVPANCTDKLQPIDVSINKPLKDELKRGFHSWYAKQMQQQLKSVPLMNVKVDVSAGIIKNNSMNWFIHAWHSLQAQPSIIINGFKKSGIFEAVAEVI